MFFCILNITQYFSQDFFTLHIRGVGQWTEKLHDYFKKEFEIQESRVSRVVSHGHGLANIFNIAIRRGRVVQEEHRSRGSLMSDNEAEDASVVNRIAVNAELPSHRVMRNAPSTVRFTIQEGA